MSILDRITDRLGWSGPLLAADKPRWAATQTLGDLCDLTARWLRGEIQSQPGYYGQCDVDEHLAPGVTDTLVALNRAGFLTDNSQAACDDTSLYPNAPWGAWLSGYADDTTFNWLRGALAGTRFGIYAWPPATDRRSSGSAVGDVPPDGPIDCRLPACDLRTVYGDCGDGAVDALLDAWQVTMYDPQPGRNDLWPVLRKAVDR